jgi:hypothetical protein
MICWDCFEEKQHVPVDDSVVVVVVVVVVHHHRHYRHQQQQTTLLVDFVSRKTCHGFPLFQKALGRYKKLCFSQCIEMHDVSFTDDAAAAVAAAAAAAAAADDDDDDVVLVPRFGGGM